MAELNNLRLFILVLALLSVSVNAQTKRPVDDPVVYKIAGMENIKPLSETYKSHDGQVLTFDLYKASGMKEGEKKPLVVFANWKRTGVTGWGIYVSWGQLLAASGLNAVIYQSAADPDADIREVVDHLRKNTGRLGIDENRLAIFTMSGNTPAAVSYMTDPARDYIKCGVIYYGFIQENPRFRKDLPLFIVRAGLDPSADLNKRLENYARYHSAQNGPLEFINYPNGQHSFDQKDDNNETKRIIKRTIDYLKEHLYP